MRKLFKVTQLTPGRGRFQTQGTWQQNTRKDYETERMRYPGTDTERSTRQSATLKQLQPWFGIKVSLLQPKMSLFDYLPTK